MTDFTRTATVKRAVLGFPARLTVEQHRTLVAEIGFNPFGFGKLGPAKTAYSYLTRMEDEQGRLAGTVCIVTPDAGADTVPSGYQGLVQHLTIPAGAFPGATGQHDPNDDLYHARFACANATEIFTLTLDRDEMEVVGYEDDAVITAIEAWANTKPECGGGAGVC